MQKLLKILFLITSLVINGLPVWGSGHSYYLQDPQDGFEGRGFYNEFALKGLGTKQVHIDDQAISFYYNTKNMDRVRSLCSQGKPIRPQLSIQFYNPSDIVAPKVLLEILALGFKDVSLIKAEFSKEFDVEALVKAPEFQKTTTLSFFECAGDLILLSNQDVMSKIKRYSTYFLGSTDLLLFQKAEALEDFLVRLVRSRPTKPIKEALFEVFLEKKNLKKLYLFPRADEEGDPTFEDMAQIMQKMTSLEELRIGGFEGGDSGLFFKELEKQIHLKKLAITFDENEPNESRRLLADFIKQKPLDLLRSYDRAMQKPESWKVVAEGLNGRKKGIKELNLVTSLLQDESLQKPFVEGISDFLKINNILEKLEVSALSSDALGLLLNVIGSTSLREINMRGSSLANNLEPVCAFLKKQPHLTYLSFADCNVGNKELMALLDALSNRGHKILLDVRGNKVDQQGLHEIQNAIKNGVLFSNEGEMEVRIEHGLCQGENLVVTRSQPGSPAFVRVDFLTDRLRSEESFVDLGLEIEEEQRKKPHSFAPQFSFGLKKKEKVFEEGKGFFSWLPAIFGGKKEDKK